MKKLTAEEKKNFLEWSEGNRYYMNYFALVGKME